MERYRNARLGGLAVLLFFVARQALFLIVSFIPLFIPKPSLIAAGSVDLLESGDLLHDLAVSAVPFFLGLFAAGIRGVPLGIVLGWGARIRYALRPLLTVFFASPLVFPGPFLVVFFCVRTAGTAGIDFL